MTDPGTGAAPARVLATGATVGLRAGVSVLVTRAPNRDGVLQCSEAVLTPQRPPACGAVPQTTVSQTTVPSRAERPAGAILPGERFTDPVSGLEIVCTRTGHGIFTFDGRPLQRRAGSGHRP
jgi:hypothetical protein